MGSLIEVGVRSQEDARNYVADLLYGHEEQIKAVNAIQRDELNKRAQVLMNRLKYFLQQHSEKRFDSASQEEEVTDAKNRLSQWDENYNENSLVGRLLSRIFDERSTYEARVNIAQRLLRDLQKSVEHFSQKSDEVRRELSVTEKQMEAHSNTNEIVRLSDEALNTYARMESEVVQRLAFGILLLRVLKVDTLNNVSTSTLFEYKKKFENGLLQIEPSDYEKANLLYEQLLNVLSDSLERDEKGVIKAASQPISQVRLPTEDNVESNSKEK